MNLFTKIISVVCVVIIVILSWAPGNEMVRTGIDGHIEHILAYTGASVFFFLTFAKSRGVLAVVIVMTLFAGIMEIGQRFVPGRNSSVWDFLASASGVVLGCAIERVARRLLENRRA